jgi:hypothetical protein
MTGSEKGDEFRRRERGLPQDRAQRPGSELTMQRDDDRATVPAELHVTASVADLLITHFGKSDDDSGAADDGERRTHAESWTVAMIGGSMSSGSASSSKYSSSASRRLASASSMLCPWLVTSTSRARATYHSPSCVMAAVNRTVTTLRLGRSRRGRLHRAKPLLVGSARVASQIWCKCRGRKLRLVMLRGRCDDVVYLLPAGVLARRAEQLVA